MPLKESLLKQKFPKSIENFYFYQIFPITFIVNGQWRRCH